MNQLGFKPGNFLKSVTVEAAFLLGERPEEGVGLAQAALVGQDQVGLALGRKAAQLGAQRRVLKHR